jgi:hypothetical protein
MRKINPVSEVNRRTNAAELARQVATTAPVCPDFNNAPVVHAFIEESSNIHGFTLVAQTLSDEASAMLEMPHVTKDRAQDTLAYLRTSLESRGIRTDVSLDRLVQLKKSRLN